MTRSEHSVPCMWGEATAVPRRAVQPVSLGPGPGVCLRDGWRAVSRGGLCPQTQGMSDTVAWAQASRSSLPRALGMLVGDPEKKSPSELERVLLVVSEARCRCKALRTLLPHPSPPHAPGGLRRKACTAHTANIDRAGPGPGQAQEPREANPATPACSQAPGCALGRASQDRRSKELCGREKGGWLLSEGVCSRRPGNGGTYRPDGCAPAWGRSWARLPRR